MAYYPFNGNAKDESGNGNDGEGKGATLTTDRHGAALSAYSFDCVDDIIAVPSIQGLDGHAVLQTLDSSEMAQSDAGCTIMVWVNPHALNGKQQVIAGKSRYSLGEREWTLMLDRDNHFRLYL